MGFFVLKEISKKIKKKKKKRRMGKGDSKKWALFNGLCLAKMSTNYLCKCGILMDIMVNERKIIIEFFFFWIEDSITYIESTG